MSFAIQAMSALYLVENKDMEREPGSMLHDVPPEIDREIAMRKIKDWGYTIDRLTSEQEKYLFG